jgi:hypothetical protein
LRYGPPAVLALLGFIVGVSATWKVFGFDDAVITYTFARNLAEGNGITWSSDGPPVYGSTTFAYTLILALAGYLGFEIPTASIMLGALFWAGSYLVLFWALEKWVGWIPMLLAMLLGAVSLKAIDLSYGMETGFYAFLAILAFALYGKNRLYLSAIACGLLVITRLEGVLVPMMILLHFLLASPLPMRERLTTVGRVTWPVVLALLGWAAFLFLYFGSILPNSFQAKTLFDGVVSGTFEVPLYLKWFALGESTSGYATTVVLFLGATLGVLRASINWRNPVYLVFLWVPAYVGMFTLSKMPDSPWYYVPVVPVIYAAFFYGAAYLFRLPRGSGQGLQRARFLLHWLVALGVASVVFSVILFNAYTSLGQIARDPFGAQWYRTDVRHRAAEAILADMETRGIKKTSVMAFEVGYIGYMVPGVVHDILGLTSREVVENGGAKNPFYILDNYEPEYAAMTDQNLYPPTGPIHQSFRFQSNYQEILAMPRADTGDTYKVFRREPRTMTRVWSLNLEEEPKATQQTDTLAVEDGLVLRSTGSDPFVVFEGPGEASGSGRLMKIRVNSSSKGLSQVFLDYGQGFTESTSTKFLLLGDGEQELATWLPPDVSPKAIRFDPLTEPGDVRLEEVSLWRPEGDSEIARSGQRTYSLTELPPPKPVSDHYGLQDVSFQNEDLYVPPPSGAAFTVNNERRPVSVEFTPSFLSKVPPAKTDGVTFEVYSGRDRVYRSHTLPSDPASAVALDLPDAKTTDELQLSFVTKAGPSSDRSYDWAIWRDVRIVIGVGE